MKSPSVPPILLSAILVVLTAGAAPDARAFDAATWRLHRPATPGAPGTLGPGGAKRVSGSMGTGFGTGFAGRAPGIAGVPELSVEVTRNAGRCAAPKVSVDGPQFFIEWPDECVFPGDFIEIYCTTPYGPIRFLNGKWEDASGAVVDTVRPLVLPCAPPNIPPSFTPPTPACGSIHEIEPGIEHHFTIAAMDSNSRHAVTLDAVGLPAGAVVSTPFPAIGNPVSLEFRWTPAAEDAGDHPITFIATDICTVRTTCRITLRVVGNRPPDCGGAVAAGAELWPPNHRLVPVVIAGVTDPDGDPLNIAVIRVTQDEPLGPRGPHCEDAVLDRGAAWVRAERLGGGNGRVYAVSFTATDGRGGECRGRVLLCVPHDRRPGATCVDDGQTVNSAGPCGAAAAAVNTEDGSAAGAPGPLRIEPLPGAGATAAVAFTLPAEGEVTLAVYDVAGRRVATVARGARSAGTHRAEWSTAGVPRGVYFYRLRSAGEAVSKAFVVAD